MAAGLLRFAEEARGRRARDPSPGGRFVLACDGRRVAWTDPRGTAIDWSLISDNSVPTGSLIRDKTGITCAMNLSVLFPPTLIRRVVDDLGAIADAVRRLPQLQLDVLDRLDRVQAELEALRDTVAPIRELPAVRRAAEPLSRQLDELHDRVEPIQELSPIRQAAEPLPDQLSALRAGLASIDDQLHSLEELRAGIEPLDADMRAVRESVDALEPLMRGLRGELAPLGELVEKIPGIG